MVKKAKKSPLHLIPLYTQVFPRAQVTNEWSLVYLFQGFLMGIHESFLYANVI